MDDGWCSIAGLAAEPAELQDGQAFVLRLTVSQYYYVDIEIEIRLLILAGTNERVLTQSNRKE